MRKICTLFLFFALFGCVHQPVVNRLDPNKKYNMKYISALSEGYSEDIKRIEMFSKGKDDKGNIIELSEIMYNKAASVTDDNNGYTNRSMLSMKINNNFVKSTMNVSYFGPSRKLLKRISENPQKIGLAKNDSDIPKYGIVGEFGKLATIEYDNGEVEYGTWELINSNGIAEFHKRMTIEVKGALKFAGEEFYTLNDDGKIIKAMRVLYIGDTKLELLSDLINIVE